MSKKVLLADDSVTIQRVVEIILADGDYDLQVADNGDAALAQARTERPNIVLADVYMPGMNGYELCSAVKQDASLAGVPVLLLSGTFEAFDESKALSSGADGWIAKPFESQALLAQVEELLARPVAESSLPETAGTASEEGGGSAVEPDMWGDLDIDSIEEQNSEALSDSENIDEVELEMDSLWDEEPLPGQEEQGVTFAAEEVGAGGEPDLPEPAEIDTASLEPGPLDNPLEEAEEEILFLDENDLLIEDDLDAEAAADEVEDLLLGDDAEPEAAADEVGDLLLGDDAETEAAADEVGDLLLGDDAEPEPAVDEVGDLLLGDAADSEAAADEASDLLLEVAAETEADAQDVSFEFVTLDDEAPEEDDELPAAAYDDSLSTASAISAEPEEVELGAAAPLAEELDFTSEEEPPVDILPDAEPLAETETAVEPEAVPAATQTAQPVAGEADTAVCGLSFFRNSGLISSLANEKQPQPAAVSEPAEAVLSAEVVTERVQGLSEEELNAIVEQVAGKVIERLAASVLEKIAWEVVPDLAESLIKEEISRITAEQG